MRVVVLGAGVLGTCLAVSLRAQGADVTLVERARPGASTTSRGAGILRLNQWHPVNVRLVRRTIEQFRAMDLDPWRFRQTGSATLLPEELAPRARELLAMQRAEGVDARRMSLDEARALAGFDEADLDGVAEVLHHPDDGWALPRLFTEITEWLAREDGLRSIRGEARLLEGAGRPEVRVGAQTLRADAVVLACGVRTRAALRLAGLDAPLVAYRTQALRLHHPRGDRVPIVHDLAQDCYLRPHWRGQMLVGDGTTTTPQDPDAWKREADEAFVASALDRARRRFPWLEGARASAAWAGLEAATPDRLPLAGPHPERPDVWLLAGGNGHGFMRAPALAESVAARVVGARPPVDVSAFDPARFAGRLSEPFDVREGSRIEGPSLM